MVLGGDWIACLLGDDDFFVKNRPSLRVGLVVDRTDAVRPRRERDHGGMRPGVLRRQQPGRRAPRVPLDVVAVPVQDRLRRWELNHRLLRLRFRAVQPGVRQRPDHPVQRQHHVWVSLCLEQVHLAWGPLICTHPLIMPLFSFCRCGAQIGGDLGSSSQALDGILGFGQADSSMLSQLAAARKVRKIFAHCLDTVRGGGIFAIGNVVQPKVKTTPLVQNVYVVVSALFPLSPSSSYLFSLSHNVPSAVLLAVFVCC
jgi:hypothetical protein